MADENDTILIIIIIFFFFILLGGCSCGGYYYYKKNGEDTFSDIKMNQEDKIANVGSNVFYNALYTDRYKYTQPPGDVRAQEYANSGQGTKGGYLPLQGIGAGTHMVNSSGDNYVIPNNQYGKIGGQPNLTGKDMDSRWIGFNNFGYPFISNDTSISDSYTISAANQRVCNSGQQCDNLKCQDWWPSLKKGKDGVCTQGSDAMVDCSASPKNINTCVNQGANRFVQSKNEAQWRKV